jgi:hypothetical protein
MLKAILRVLHIIREEAGKRKWLSAVKALIALVGYVGVSVLTLDPLLRGLFPSSVVVVWVIIISLAVVIALLVVINFMRTFHERALADHEQALAETRAEWDRREPILEKLYALNTKGQELRERCNDRSKGPEPLSDEDLRQIRAWHSDAAYTLENKLGIEYRRRFYEHSPTGEMPPESSHDCSVWINTRRHKLKEVIAELRQPPARLVSRAEEKQLEAGIRIAGWDQFDD